MLLLLSLACVGSDDGALRPSLGSDRGESALSRVSTGSPDLMLTASDAERGDYFGYAVAALGDVDGDGFDDVAVGAYHDMGDRGSVYIYFGSRDGLDPDREQKLYASDRQKDDRFGFSLAGAGDVDGDGYADLIVGAPRDDDEATNAGAAYVFYGGPSGFDADVGIKLVGSGSVSSQILGTAVAGAGDVNGDGYADVAVGAPGGVGRTTGTGTVLVYYGGSDGLSDASFGEIYASDGATLDSFGTSLDGAGDVDGDGYDDVIVGAWLDDDNGSASGSAYLFYGDPDGMQVPDQEKLKPTGGGALDYFGRAVAGAGDVDGDGFADVVIGAPQLDQAFSDDGGAYVFYGDSAGVDLDRETVLAATATASAASKDLFGMAVAGVGDVDGDGLDDIVVGMYGSDLTASNAGAAVLFYGDAAGPGADYADALRASDGAASDAFGFAVSGAGDVDADGFSDLLVGAYGRDDGGVSSGSVYVFQGPADLDDDGSSSDVDCDDRDDSMSEAVMRFADLDGDGLGDPRASAMACPEDPGYADNSFDCDDADASIGSADASLHPDADGDGLGDFSTVETVCTGSLGYVSDGSDCDDGDADVGADQVTWYIDGDGDGYGDPGEPAEVCAGTPGYAAEDSDCDDADPAINPGAAEVIADGVDQDCDLGDSCYLDADDDGVRPDETSVVASVDLDCADSGEASAEAPTGDCDDSVASTAPGAEEIIGDEIDQDCDGGELCWLDADDDGHANTGSRETVSADTDCADTREARADEPADDCNDGSAVEHPGAPDVPGDGVDQDCDGEDAAQAEDSGEPVVEDIDDVETGYAETGDPVVEDSGEVATGEAHEPEVDQSTCGCSTAERGVGFGWLGGLLAVAAARRRRG